MPDKVKQIIAIPNVNIYENNKFPEMIIPMSIFTSQLRKTKIELASGIFALSFIIAGISI